MYRLLLLADHKARDLPALAALRLSLEKIDPSLEVRVISFDLHQQAVEFFHPHIIVLPHIHGNRNQKLADTVRRRGGLCVVLPTEGRPNSYDRMKWAVEEWPHRLCDLYLAWSDEMGGRLSGTVPVEVVGGPRFDFYRTRLSDVIPSRDEMIGLLRLDPARPIVTIASSFPQAKFTYINTEFHDKDWRDLKMTTIPGHEDPVKFAEIEMRLFKKFQSWIAALRSEMPDTQIIVKPHPAEAVSMWDRFCYENDCYLLLSGYIWDMLAVSDCHIVRADCVTTSEAWMMDKPVVTIDLGNTAKDGPGFDAMNLTANFSQMNDFMDYMRWMIDGGSQRFGDVHNEYIHRWLTPERGSIWQIASHLIILLEKRAPVVDGPSLEDRVKLESALKSHEAQNAVPQIDYAGQFNKAVKRSDVNSWIHRLNTPRILEAL